MANKTFLITLMVIGLCSACQSMGPAAPTRTPTDRTPRAARPTAVAEADLDPTISTSPTERLMGRASERHRAVDPIAAETVNQVARTNTLTGHTDRVYGLNVSSDGRWLASGGVGRPARPRGRDHGRGPARTAAPR